MFKKRASGISRWKLIFKKKVLWLNQVFWRVFLNCAHSHSCVLLLTTYDNLSYVVTKDLHGILIKFCYSNLWEVAEFQKISLGYSFLVSAGFQPLPKVLLLRQPIQNDACSTHDRPDILCSDPEALVLPQWTWNWAKVYSFLPSGPPDTVKWCFLCWHMSRGLNWTLSNTNHTQLYSKQNSQVLNCFFLSVPACPLLTRSPEMVS